MILLSANFSISPLAFDYLMNVLNHHIGNERVAIILCCYNSGAYLIDQLQSIFTQSHKGCEVHLFDDNSPVPFDFDKIGEMGLSANVSTVTSRSKNVGVCDQLHERS